MRCKTLVTTVIVLGSIGVLSTPVAAEGWDYYWWLHPCADDPENQQTCKYYGETEQCWCDGEWDNHDHWDSNPDGYPSDPNDSPTLWHSNTGYCDGGDNDGDPCSENGDCPNGVCDNYEVRLELALVTETIAWLEIITADTTATEESLTIKFEGTGTLTTSGLILGASNGPIELKMSGSTAIETE